MWILERIKHRNAAFTGTDEFEVADTVMAYSVAKEIAAAKEVMLRDEKGHDVAWERSLKVGKEDYGDYVNALANVILGSPHLMKEAGMLYRKQIREYHAEKPLGGFEL